MPELSNWDLLGDTPLCSLMDLFEVELFQAELGRGSKGMGYGSNTKDSSCSSNFSMFS